MLIVYVQTWSDKMAAREGKGNSAIGWPVIENCTCVKWQNGTLPARQCIKSDWFLIHENTQGIVTTQLRSKHKERVLSFTSVRTVEADILNNYI